MLKIEKSIFIDAQVREVFAFLAEPASLLAIWPGRVEIRNVQPLPNGGCCYDWEYRMAGVRLQGQVESPAFILNERMVLRATAGILGTLVLIYQPEQGGTRLIVNIEYSLPEAVVSRLPEPAAHKLNEQEVDNVLANLKTRLEA